MGGGVEVVNESLIVLHGQNEIIIMMIMMIIITITII